MNKKALCVIGLLLLTGCGSNETATTTVVTEVTTEVTTEKPTEKKTEKVTEKTTEKSTTKMTDKQAKAQDVTTAGNILVAFTKMLANEAAFDEFVSLPENDGVLIQPLGDYSYTYLFGEGRKTSNIEAVMNNYLIGTDPAFCYSGSDWKPVLWVLSVDEDFRPYICIYTEDERFIEVLPNTDPLFFR